MNFQSLDFIEYDICSDMNFQSLDFIEYDIIFLTQSQLAFGIFEYGHF